MRSRPAVFSIDWWVTRCPRCCGTRSGAACPAGRVQTVAVRLIVEREREIKAFLKQEYWTIDAHLAGPKPPAFDARFLGKGEEKVEVTNLEDAEKIRAALEKADWLGRSVDRQARRR